MNRLKRGDIYAADKAQRAMDNFFKESTLAALRELALRQTAHELEFRESAEPSDPNTFHQESSGRLPAPGKTMVDRILVYVTASASSAMLIRRGRRMADYLGADCFAVCVFPVREGARVGKEDRESVERHLNFARNLHIETRILQGDDPARTIVDFARRNQITQILLSRCPSSAWGRLFSTDLILNVVREARDIRVIIVADRRRPFDPAMA
jgi:two-component system sensor histidine kinase KdpD